MIFNAEKRSSVVNNVPEYNIRASFRFSELAYLKSLSYVTELLRLLVHRLVFQNFPIFHKKTELVGTFSTERVM